NKQFDRPYYSKYDPGLPLLAVPFYVIGDWIAEINAAHRYHVAALAVLLLPVIAAALAVVGVARLVGALSPEVETVRPGQSKACKGARCNRTQVITILAAGLATPLWVYARTLFAETILAAALTWAVVIICRSSPHPPAPSPFDGEGESSRECNIPSLLTGRGLGGEVFAGIVFGIGILTRAAFAIYLPALIWLIVRSHPAQRWRDRAIRLVVFGAGIAPFAALLLWHNAYRFGDPLQFGYEEEGFTTPVWEGVVGLLISPGKSVFLYAPPLILSVILWPRFRRVYPALGAFLAVAWGSALVFYGAWWAWHGGWCWGPRFLVPLLPLSCLPFVTRFVGEHRCVLPVAQSSTTQIPGFVMQGGPIDPPLQQQLAIWLLIFGLVIQLLGVLTDVTPHYAALTTPDGSTDYAALHIDPREAGIGYAARQVIAGHTEPRALLHLNDTGLPPSWTWGVPVLCVIGLLWSGWRLLLFTNDCESG
ncbi:MAG: hypothetical protein JXA10_13640, partial [Anaerolineae bacterium]|nr:hypothetical protein [Anaerolineae bacterium]